MLSWVKEIVEEEMPCSLEIGKVVKHPDGRAVKIMAGQYWGTHGLSNFWYWREVLPDGTLSAKEEHGYGWNE